MFGIGGTELIIILVFGLLIFGPDKMPQMGRTIGRALRQFQRAQDDMTRVLKAELYSKDDERGDSALKMPDLEEFLTRKSDATKASQEAKAAKAARKAPVGSGADASAAVEVEKPAGSMAAALWGVADDSTPAEPSAEEPEPAEPEADTGTATTDGKEADEEA